ncbi:MAG: ABC transporter permease [Oscillospiraceae bacterium]|jgi:peptide/nickel transport system permease protein
MKKVVSKPAAGASQDDVILRKRSQTKDIWIRFRSNKLAMAGMVIVILIVLSAVFAEFLTPYDYSAQDYNSRFLFPSWEHPFGTDNYGRDLLSRVMYGGRISLLVSLLGLVISLVIGGILGATAGYFGGLYESTIMRLMDIIMAIPGMLMAVSISALLGTGMLNTAIAVSVGGIAPSARMLRAVVLTIREQEYIEAARARGSRNVRIIFRQILPNTLSPIIVDATLRIGGNIMMISGLSFIGLGVQPPTPEWGSILNSGRDYISSFWPIITFPGIAIMLTMFGFNVMGDGLRDALDPKLKR